jgi:hypothetical protein
MILVTRKRSHPATIAYIERRLQEGKTGDAHSLSVTDRPTERQAEARATTGCGIEGSEQAP